MATDFNTNAIASGGGFKPSPKDTPTRIGERIETLDDILSIPNPWVGMIVYVRDIGKRYEVLSLKKVQQGLSEVSKVDQYREIVDKEYVDEAIANAQLGNGEVDLSAYATKEYVEQETASVLNGKTFICIGDSFVKGHTLTEQQTWAYKLANRHNMTYHKHAVNGVSLTHKTGQSSQALITTIDDFISDVSATDYVLVLVGHNDANPSLNGGSAVPIGNNTDKVTTSFKGALNLLIDKLYTKYPMAKLLFLTPFNRTGIEEPYVEAMKEVCSIWCIPCFDNYHSGGICFQNVAQASKYELGDSLHLNEAGQERVSYLYESLLANELPISNSLNINVSNTNTEIETEIEQLTTYISQLEERIAILESGNNATIYRVTYDLTNVSSSNIAKSIIEGKQYTTNLSSEKGYKIDTVVVTMGGEDVTSTVYSEGVVIISEVTGDIVITATAIESLNFEVWDVSHWTRANADFNRAYIWTPTEIPSGAIVDFVDQEMWSTYKFAISFDNNNVSSSWIGGSYQTTAYTVTDTKQYTIMIARLDNNQISVEELKEIANSFGYKI